VTTLTRGPAPSLGPLAASPAPRPARRARTLALATAVGLVAAGGAAATVANMPALGSGGILVGAVLVLAIPTSHVLSRRILVTGALLLGFTPMLWWVHLPVGTLGRAGLVASLVVGGLSAWLAAGGRHDLRRRVRSLVPGVAVIDTVPLLAALASAWVVSGWLRARTGSAALAALAPGWDNSAHVDMVQMLVRHGVTLDRIAAPTGQVWHFLDYPQGYHTIVATLIEAAGAPSAGDAASMLVSYLHAEAWVVVLLGGLLGAAVCSLPRLRRRPAVAMPAAALVVAAYVTGAGATAFVGGFPNFVFAAALAACVPLLVASMPRVPMPLHVAAVGALLVGVANAWILLLAVAAPAAAALAFPAAGARWRGTRRQWAGTAAVLVVVTAGMLAPARLLAGLSAGAVLTVPGGIAAQDPGFSIAVALAAAVVCLGAGATGGPARFARHAATPLVGLVTVGLVGAWQVHATGALSYYFYKLLLGVGLVSLAVLVAGLSGLRLPAAISRPSRRARVRLAALVTIATVAAAELTGLTLTGHRAFTAPLDPGTPMSAIIPAAGSRASAQSSAATLLVSAPESVRLNAQQWYLALTGRWTTKANDDASRILLTPGSGPATIAALLDESPDAIVLVDPSTVAVVRQTIQPAARQARVVGW